MGKGMFTFAVVLQVVISIGYVISMAVHISDSIYYYDNQAYPWGEEVVLKGLFNGLINFTITYIIFMFIVGLFKKPYKKYKRLNK